jgi:DNA polymerase elongation subunit (family B)
MSRKIYQFDLNNKFVGAHKSVTKAANKLRVDESTIRKAADKEGRTAAGFIWRRNNEYKAERKLPKILVFDIETAPLEAYVFQKSVWKANVAEDQVIGEWFMLTWSAKWLFNENVMSAKLTGREALEENDSRITAKLWALFDEADIVIAHNGGNFDVPNMNTRFIVNGFPPPSSYQIIDTLKIARKEFGFTHNNLNALARVFGFDGKIETNFQLWKDCKHGSDKALAEMETYNKRDVTVLEEIYLKLRPWMKSHPNVGLFMESDIPRCPYCGSDAVRLDGEYYYTMTGKYPTYRCNSCDGISRGRKTSISKEKSQNLIVSIAR